jgi:hypothetical protein
MLGLNMFGVLKGWFGEKLATFGMWLRLDETSIGALMT